MASSVTMETDNIKKYANSAQEITEHVAPELIKLTQQLTEVAKKSGIPVLTSQVGGMEEATVGFLKINKQFADTVQESARTLQAATRALE